MDKDLLDKISKMELFSREELKKFTPVPKCFRDDRPKKRHSEYFTDKELSEGMSTYGNQNFERFELFKQEQEKEVKREQEKQKRIKELKKAIHDDFEEVIVSDTYKEVIRAIERHKNSSSGAKSRRDVQEMHELLEDDVIINLCSLSIEELDLSKRTNNALIRNGIFTVRQLFSHSEYQLDNARGVGKQCLEEILEAVKRFEMNEDLLDRLAPK